MPEAYCHCCGKVTAHKVVMGRCKPANESGWQGAQEFLALLLKGKHYHKLEPQYYCRVCNQRCHEQQAEHREKEFHDVSIV
ncbi:hypothetical protein [Vibrio tritonius]|uniref:hypothetical protein n=1 Tax=Vibrio tritonius TaxID=1435069 RepID=UPI0008399D6E|nr:hypothetical protein [Vibrio tritonius]